ncbi:hypothetical protein [Halobellus sp. GM3]|uniref:hypothetical protein n=1 Tax=Halobellus sp. GM3 TaxID=3458410 RepID=UPI00403E308A
MPGETSGTGPGLAGTLARVAVAVCFVGGAALAVTGRLVLAGTAFLVGHTFLAAAAIAGGRRRRGVGLSLSGVGWVALSIGLGANSGAGAPGVEAFGTPLLVAGMGLVTVGMLLVISASGGDGDDARLETRG